MKILLFGLLLLYCFIGEPLLETRVFRHFIQHQNSLGAREHMYQHAFVRTWLMCLAFFALAIYFQLPLAQFGFQWPTYHHNIHQFSYDILLLLFLFLGGVYFVYYYYLPILASRFNAKVREKTIQKLLGFKSILPVNAREKTWWSVNALSAVVEELLYRGVVFYYVLSFFSGWYGVVTAIGVSLFFDAFRYIGRLKAFVYVFFSSTIFVLSYVLFHSIYVPMILHVVHDIRVLFMPIDQVVTADNNRN